MPPLTAARPDQTAEPTSRRSVVPEAAGRSLWWAAIWTGVGAAVVCATLSIVGVAIAWLPVSGASGHAMSAVRAGLLTFVAAVHGGVTVDGTGAQFVPLGLTLGVALAAWRAGSGLGDVAVSMGEQDRTRLVGAGALAAMSFAVAVVIAIPFAHLGTSSAPYAGAGLASFALFAVVGGTAFIRACALRELVAGVFPDWLVVVARAAGAGVSVYLGAGAVLVAGALILHAGRVQALSEQIGTGWGGVPLLALGLLAAPNAAIAGTSYLAGPGFAVGSGTTVNAVASTHGVLPAFPLLGALPTGHGASPAVWVLMALTPLAAGAAIARIVYRCEAGTRRFGTAFGAALLAALVLVVLAWQGGGDIGGGRLSTIGASPGLVGLAAGAALAVVSAVVLSVGAVGSLLTHRGSDLTHQRVPGTLVGWRERLREETVPATRVPAAPLAGDEPDEGGQLAG